MLKTVFVCGIDNPVGLHLSFEEQRPGEVTADCILEEKYEGYPGIVHGGIVASMLDEISSRALMGNPEQPRFPFTARINVRYRNMYRLDNLFIYEDGWVKMTVNEQLSMPPSQIKPGMSSPKANL